LTGTGGIVLLLVSVWWFSCPTIYVIHDTSLWGTKWDARFGPGTPIGGVKTGDRLRVLWEAQGKDQIAYFVLAPDCRKGWVLYGQEGIKLFD